MNYYDGTPPSRSHEQRLNALERANQIRTARAELKREIRHGARTLESLLDHPDTASMKVLAALLEVPKIGPTKARRIMKSAGCSPSKTFGGLTDRQREDLIRFTEHYRPYTPSGEHA